MKNKALKLEGLTDTQINAAIAVAGANGGKKHNNFDNHNCKDYLYLCITKNSSIGYDIIVTKELTTLEEWLFYGAPDWAIDIRLGVDGRGFWYTDGTKKVRGVCESARLDKEIRNGSDRMCRAEVIATRQQEEWAPNLDESVMYADGDGCHDLKGVVVYIEGNEAVIRREDGLGIDVMEFHNMSPLPKYTDEQLLAYELYKSLNTGGDEDIEAFYSVFPSDSNVWLNAIKDGWKK